MSSLSRGPQVVAVVVTRNRRDSLMRCLQALLGGKAVPGEVVVVDNGSTDGSVSAVRSAYPQVRLVESTENLGPAAGFARGMEVALKATCDWVMPLNDDCYVESTTLAELLAVAVDVDHTVGILAPAVRHGGHDDLGYVWRHYPVPVRTLPGAESARVVAADMVTFNAALIRTSAIRRWGLPRADYFMMWWEWEYCLRFRDHGLRVLVVPWARALHETIGSAAGQSPAWRGYYQSRNHLRFALDRGSMADGVFWLVREAKLAAAVLLRGDQKIRRLRMRLVGAVDAVRGRMGQTVVP
jgi:GT2 family glycosyltransferase